MRLVVNTAASVRRRRRSVRRRRLWFGFELRPVRLGKPMCELRRWG